MNPLLGLVLAAALLGGGCASEKAAPPSPAAAAAHIVDFLTVEDDAALTVVIRGDRPLTYTALQQDAPLRLSFQFPETGLDQLASVYYPPENEVVGAIRAEEFQGPARNSRIVIELKKDTPYRVESQDADLRIVFAKPGGPARKGVERPTRPPAAVRAPAAVPPAVTLKSVRVTTQPERTLIRLAADGVVMNYKTFTLDDPARFVVDLIGLKSVVAGEQQITVQSGQVRKVRYFAHPDRVRVVVETTAAALTSCRVEPSPEGLVIVVGSPQAVPSGRWVDPAAGGWRS
jgi:hypothetical protein